MFNFPVRGAQTNGLNSEYINYLHEIKTWGIPLNTIRWWLWSRQCVFFLGRGGAYTRSKKYTRLTNQYIFPCNTQVLLYRERDLCKLQPENYTLQSIPINHLYFQFTIDPILQHRMKHKLERINFSKCSYTVKFKIVN